MQLLISLIRLIPSQTRHHLLLHQVTAECVFSGESSPSMDSAGQPLVDVVIGILLTGCHYEDFNLCCYPHAPAVPDAVTKFITPTSVSRGEPHGDIVREGVSGSVERAGVGSDPDKIPVMFKPELVTRLGTIARKLLTVIDIIHKSSSAVLAQVTEVWKFQWHFEARVFIENRVEIKDGKPSHNLAACNRRVLTFFHNQLLFFLLTFVNGQYLLRGCRRCSLSCSFIPPESLVHRNAALVQVRWPHRS
jgi:hypothetical protein